MKSTSKKGSQKPNRKSRSRPLQKRRAAPKKTSGLERQIVALKREVAEGLEQQTATGKVLRIIAGSPTELQPVMDTIAASAVRLCDSDDAHIYRVDGDVLRLAAKYGTLLNPPDGAISRQTVRGRAVVDRKTIHIHDFREVATEFPKAGGEGV